MVKKIIIVGGFHEVIELCEDLNFTIVGIIDNNFIGHYLGYPVIGSDHDAYSIYEKYRGIPLVITPDAPKLRESLSKYYSDIGFDFQTIISPRSKVSKSAIIGCGAIIQDGVNVSANTSIGKFAKLNTGSNVMHDCNIGDFVTIAPNAVVLGKVRVKNYAYIGANSTILPNLEIAEFTIIGAGAVLTKNTEKSNVLIGIPAKQKM